MALSVRKFDTIVIGSGIGGLAAAAALAKCDQRVLVLEQHFQVGGLTQTFRRGEYTFATGLHYIGGVGKAPESDNQFGHMLSWLTDGQLRFASLGSPYDIVRLPSFEFHIDAPRAAYIHLLKSTFPREIHVIDHYFTAIDDVQTANMALFAAKVAPMPIAAILRWFNAKRIRRALETTSADAVRGIGDTRLATLLSARWGLYGITPSESPFAVHALVTGSYFNGAYYPIGGPAAFAEALGDTVRASGGEIRVQAYVSEIIVNSGRVAGVRLDNGETIKAPLVVSAMGARNTMRYAEKSGHYFWGTMNENGGPNGKSEEGSLYCGVPSRSGQIGHGSRTGRE